jgi:hypothetical protein
LKEHQNTLQIGQTVLTLHPIRGWFDYSIKSEMPAHMVGTIFKIHKLDEVNISDTIYTVQFDKEFGFVDIKHSDLEPVKENGQTTQA